MIIMPLIGKLSDKIDKLRVFIFGSVWAIIMIIIYTNLPVVPLWVVIAVNILLFIGILFYRMIDHSLIAEYF